MQLKARRIFRFALVTALSATTAFALQLSFSMLPPVLAILLGAGPAAPPTPRALLALLVVVLLTTGLLLVPLLMNTPLTALLLVGLGLFASSWLMVHLNQTAVGTFLAMGFVLISAVGLANEQLARLMVDSLAGGIIIVIVIQWLVHPFLPEEPPPPRRPAPGSPGGRRGGMEVDRPAQHPDRVAGVHRRAGQPGHLDGGPHQIPHPGPTAHLQRRPPGRAGSGGFHLPRRLLRSAVLGPAEHHAQPVADLPPGPGPGNLRRRQAPWAAGQPLHPPPSGSMF